MWICTCLDVHGGQRHHIWSCLKCLLSSLTECSLSVQLYWLASVPQLCLAPVSARVKVYLLCLASYIGSGYPTTGPHVCPASTLQMGPIPSTEDFKF